jgi:hypothetical protein
MQLPRVNRVMLKNIKGISVSSLSIFVKQTLCSIWAISMSCLVFHW